MPVCHGAATKTAPVTRKRRYVSLPPYAVTSPQSQSPFDFWGLIDSFLGVFVYTTQLSFTPLPIFGAAVTPDFSWLAPIYRPPVCASTLPNCDGDKTLLLHEGTKNIQPQ